MVKQTVLSVTIVGALVLGACCRSDHEHTDMCVCLPYPDAGTEIEEPPLVCNPVTQAGCATGEKCGELIHVADDEATPANEFLAQIACVPDGEVAKGEACEIGMPGRETGFDDCVAGYDCFQGVCVELCGSAPDTCQADPPSPFGMGSHCANNFQGHFNDTTGVCLAACDPTVDTIEPGLKGAEPEAVNETCGAGSSCGLNAVTAQTTCAGTPGPAATQTQNEVPYGPGVGQYFSNGCASGFSLLLNEKVGADGGEPQCTRYCTPQESYLDAGGVQVGDPEGASTKCGTAGLAAIGGKGGHNQPHQCRFIQAIYSNTDMVPASVGMCMPVQSRGGAFTLENGLTTNPPANTWGDCSTFAWGEIKEAWNAAAPNGIAAANAAFDAVCINMPDNQMAPDARFLQKCIGFFYGCTSLEEAGSLDTPAGSSARSGGQLLRDRFNLHMSATPEQLEGQGIIK